MSQPAVTIVMVTGAVLAFRWLLRAQRTGRASGDIDSAAVFVFCVGWIFSLPRAAVASVGGGQVVRDAFGEPDILYPEWYDTAGRWGNVAVVVLSAAIILRCLSRDKRILVNPAPLFAILLWVVSALATYRQGGNLLAANGLALLACLAAATVLPRGRGAAVGAAAFGVSLAIAGGLLTLFRYDTAVLICQSKCSVIGGLFAGTQLTENTLGIALAAAIPFVFIGFRTARYPLVIYLAAMVMATGSRTSMLVAAVGVVAVFALRPSLDDEVVSAGRMTAGWVLLIGSVVASVGVVKYVTDPGELTGRPLLWHVAWTYIHDAPWLGWGADKWASLYQQTGEISRFTTYATHNQWVEVLFVAGLFGLAAFVALLVAVVLTPNRPARLAALVTLALMLLFGATERPWSFVGFDWMTFSYVAVLLIGHGRMREDRDVTVAHQSKTDQPRSITSRSMAFGTGPPSA